MAAPGGPASGLDKLDKAALRRELGASRRARTDAEIATARAAVRTAVLHRWSAARWACVAGYLPLGTEPGSVELLEALGAEGVRVLVPELLPDRDLDWRSWPDGQLLGVEAISGADMVLVPALAVAPDGTRLGRGGGSYDRALARVGANVPVVALLHEGELLARLPRDAWDRPVSAVVTPTGWHDLSPADV